MYAYVVEVSIDGPLQLVPTVCITEHVNDLFIFELVLRGIWAWCVAFRRSTIYFVSESYTLLEQLLKSLNLRRIRGQKPAILVKDVM